MKRWQTLIFVAVIFALIFAVGLSVIQVAEPLAEYQQARGEYRALREIAQVPSPSLEVAEPGSVETGIDWAALRAINPNVVGWILIPGTSIDYPIVQTTDNATYLRRTFSGEQNPSGAIFMDRRSVPDFSHPNTIIHGHNMRDGSMFAELMQFRDYAFLEAHPIIIIFTPNGDRVYEIFTAPVVSQISDIYSTDHQPEEADGQPIVTLSTCVNGSPELRMVVKGRLIHS